VSNEQLTHYSVWHPEELLPTFSVQVLRKDTTYDSWMPIVYGQLKRDVAISVAASLLEVFDGVRVVQDKKPAWEELVPVEEYERRLETTSC